MAIIDDEGGAPGARQALANVAGDLGPGRREALLLAGRAAVIGEQRRKRSAVECARAASRICPFGA